MKFLLTNFSFFSGYAMLPHKGQTAVIPCAVAGDTEHSQWKSWNVVNANIIGAVT